MPRPRFCRPGVPGTSRQSLLGSIAIGILRWPWPPQRQRRLRQMRYRRRHRHRPWFEARSLHAHRRLPQALSSLLLASHRAWPGDARSQQILLWQRSRLALARRPDPSVAFRFDSAVLHRKRWYYLSGAAILRCVDVVHRQALAFEHQLVLAENGLWPDADSIAALRMPLLVPAHCVCLPVPFRAVESSFPFPRQPSGRFGAGHRWIAVDSSIRRSLPEALEFRWPEPHYSHVLHRDRIGGKPARWTQYRQRR